MDIRIVDRQERWRHRGRPPRVAPQEILDLLESGYRPPGLAGKAPAVEVVLEDDDTEDDARELLSLLRAGARQLGKHLRLARDGRVIRFFLTDAPLPRKKALA